jgi:hypothetical protein
MFLFLAVLILFLISLIRIMTLSDTFIVNQIGGGKGSFGQSQLTLLIVNKEDAFKC